MKVGIIGGTGWMGKAMGDALLKNALVVPNDLWIANQSGNNNYVEPIQFTTNPQQLCDACDVIILSVLPKQFSDIQLNAQNKCVISIMAMVPAEHIMQQMQTTHVIRAMPNAAIPESESYTPWFAVTGVTLQHKNFANAIFKCFGTQDEYDNEDQLNFMTALTGSSHGWLAYVADAFITAGISHQIPRDRVERGVRQVMKGVGRLIANENATPEETVKILTDYAGTTAAGLNSFADSDIATLLSKGIIASYRKAKG